MYVCPNANFFSNSLKECHGTCDQEVTWMSGRISPVDCDLDGFYDYNTKCTWLIVGEYYLGVKVNILDLDIQEDIYCIFDSLQVSIHYANMLIQIY